MTINTKLSDRKENVMRKVNFQIEKESWDDMHEAGRWNPSLEVIFRDKTGNHRHKIESGYMDDLYAYRESDETYILSINDGLCYIGLDAFRGDERLGDVFLECHQVEEFVGKKGLDLAPHTIIRRLLPYLGY